MEIGNVEVLLAQKLSSGEPRIRKKAFYRLEQRINARSANNSYCEKDDFLKLWKGLYYCFWLQDKPLLQEDLVDNITKLLASIRDRSQKLLFIESFYEEIGKEYNSVDQWRMDKYLMLYRRMFRRILTWLKSEKWCGADIADVCNILKRSVLSPKGDIYPAGLKLHFANIFMDELDNAGAGTLSAEQILNFLKPFFNLLSDRATSDVHFNAILDDIFKLILEYCSDLLDKKDESTSEPILEFDLHKIKTLLFDIGKSASMISKRRVKLYAMVNLYETLISGSNPFSCEISDVDDIDESDVDEAAMRLVNSDVSLSKGNQKRCKQVSKKRKRPAKHSGNEEDGLVKSAKSKKQKKSGKEQKTKNKFKVKRTKKI